MPKTKKPKLVQVKRKLTGTDAKRQKQQEERRLAEAKLHQQHQAQAAARQAIKAARTRRGFAFAATDTVLLVGEGNFSFAAAIFGVCAEGPTTTDAVQTGQTPPVISITATALDDEATVRTKYNDADKHLETLAAHGAQILYGVDATALTASCKSLRGRLFSKVVFNFPHTGAGIKDQARNVSVNQALLVGFFMSVKPLLKPRCTHRNRVDTNAANNNVTTMDDSDNNANDTDATEDDDADAYEHIDNRIDTRRDDNDVMLNHTKKHHEKIKHKPKPKPKFKSTHVQSVDQNGGMVYITLKTGQPYDQWDIKQIARAAGFQCVQSFGFRPQEFPGYSHRRTIGFETGVSVDDNSEITKTLSRTYVFALEDPSEPNQ